MYKIYVLEIVYTQNVYEKSDNEQKNNMTDT